MMRFDDFQEGDLAIFQRTFSTEDFERFAVISGDRNPLHHDEAYAASTAFGRTIAPLHLTMAPLSSIAGMILPGRPSLYLGHEIRASKAVHYGDRLVYSARVMAINRPLRVLTIRVLALRGAEVVLDTEMRVQSTAEEWPGDPPPLLHPGRPRWVFVTGGTGHIGRMVVRLLHADGWHILIQDRGNETQRHEALGRLIEDSERVRFVAADLASKSGLDALCTAIDKIDGLAAIVHAASPPVDASLDDLVAVNYTALRRILDASLASMLARQDGHILNLGSTAMLKYMPSWENYSAAKQMSAGLVTGLRRSLSSYGIHAATLMPSAVATPFAARVPASVERLLPGQVAEAVRDLLNDPRPTDTVLEVSGTRRGDLTFHDHSTGPEARRHPHPSPAVAAVQAEMRPDNYEDVASIIRGLLGLTGDYNLTGGGLDRTPGWDSLKQVEIVLALERELGLALDSGDINRATTYDELCAICTAKGRPDE